MGVRIDCHSSRAGYFAIIIGVAVSIAVATSQAQDTQARPRQTSSLDELKLSVTVLPQLPREQKATNGQEPLTGQEPTINVSKISLDGVVVGSAPPRGDVLRWLPSAAAPENLGGAPAFTLLNRLPLLSADGATIIANRQITDANGITTSIPSTWRQRGEWTPLPQLTLRTSIAVGLSRDGIRIVGYGWNDASTEPSRPWVWDAEEGQQVLPVSDRTNGGEAWAVSDDGRVIVGQQFDVPNPADARKRFFATRWVDGNARALTDATGAPLGQAFSCSSDCSVIVGGGQGGDPNPQHRHFGQAWRWTEATGAVYLGTLRDAAPQTPSFATDVSADGVVVIGTYSHLNEEDGSISQRGFLWTESTGMVSILQLMAEHGISQGSDWRTIVPVAITPTGNMILIGGLDANLIPGGFILHVD